jgi:RNA polymerase sigma factor (sigma-70 family)
MVNDWVLSNWAEVMTDKRAEASSQIESCLTRLQSRDVGVRTELLKISRPRLLTVTRRMFSKFPRLHRLEEVDDVFQAAMVRLWQSLEQTQPRTVSGFLALTALQVRRVLLDMVRNHFGRDESPGRSRVKRLTALGQLPGNRSRKSFDQEPDEGYWAPDELACWSEFHVGVVQLPARERMAFDLLYYCELNQADAADAMGVSSRQVRRYWRSALSRLRPTIDVSPAD